MPDLMPIWPIVTLSDYQFTLAPSLRPSLSSVVSDSIRRADVSPLEIDAAVTLSTRQPVLACAAVTAPDRASRQIPTAPSHRARENQRRRSQPDAPRD